MMDDEPERNQTECFECNICLDPVQDPVVTLCGHLYCWPCIYKWIQSSQTVSSEDHQHPQCPVCKTDVSVKTLVPLYGRGLSKTKPSETMMIPQRPPSQVCGSHVLASSRTATDYPQSYPGSYVGPDMMNHLDGARGNGLSQHPMMNGMFCEMDYMRMFGNSGMPFYSHTISYDLPGSSSLRMRRQMINADRSLGRICFFLCCCLVLCLLLF